MTRNWQPTLRAFMALVLTMLLIVPTGAMAEGQDADVIVIGAGGAGLSAAIVAHDAGAKVIVLEKMAYAGGNTIRSKGGLNAAGTSVQAGLGIEDDIEVFIEDTISGGKSLNDRALVRFMAENSAAAVDWLLSIGMDVTDVGQGAGATNARMHRPAGGKSIGGFLVKSLSDNVSERGIEVRLNTRATELITEGGAVTGVKATDANGNEIALYADAVIIATGGFGANEEIYAQYRPDLAGFITTNHPGATGDGMVMAESVGAALVDVDQIQTNPTVEQGTTEVISESIRGLGAIFVNQDGVRFTSEMLTRDVLSSAILEQPGQYTYIIFDQNLRQNMGAVEEMVALGIVTEGATIEELAQQIGIDADTLTETLGTWNAAVAAGADQAFGRETGLDHDLTKAPYYAIKVAPGVHHTMGGIKINADTQVISVEGSAIPGLYAAGEVTGGVHGANRLGGNAVADIIIFGRQAGAQAALLALENGSLMGDEAAAQPESAATPIKEGAPADLNDGTYEATSANGRGGDITIEAIVEGGQIVSIATKAHSETDGIYASVEANLFPTIIFEQSADVDSISGATMSSVAVLEAVADILAQAK